MAWIVALIALANASGVGFIWRSRQMRIYREHEQWLRQMADETPALLWITTADGTGVFINKPLAEFVGAPQEQKIVAGLRANLHPDDVERIAKNYYNCVATRSEYVDEHRLRRFDGEYRWFHARGRPRFASDGRFLGYAGSLFDITEHKAAEDQARASAELVRGQNRVLELIAQNAPLRTTLDLLVRVLEALSPDMLGSVLLLDPDRIHLRHGSAPSLPDAYTQAIDGEPIGPAAGSCGTAAYRREPVIVEDIATDPLWENYREFALSHGLRACWSTPIFEEKACNGRDPLGTFAFYFRSPGRPTARHRELIEMATQIAALAIVKSRETEALQNSEERLRLATTYGKLGVWEWQIDADRLICSESLLAIFDWAKEAGDLTLDKFLNAVHPDDRDRVETAVRTAIAKHADYDMEYRIILRNGSLRWIGAYGRTQYGAAGESLRMLGVAQDVTQRKQTEQRLREVNTALAQELEERARTEEQIQALSARLMSAQEEERSRLARELHDDLSQQIAALSMAVSNLRAGVPSEFAEVRSQSEHIREKLANLGEGIRRISHELHPAVLQYSGLDSALRAYCSEFAALAGIAVAFRSDGSFADVPPALALCAYRITQEALQNVLKHARTDEATVAVTRSGRTVKLIISDNGIGMNLNTTRVSGGLGLTSIRERARLVNGTVEIQSRPGRGTTLILTIPN
jgi:PAS domain S-box-containing protein